MAFSELVDCGGGPGTWMSIGVDSMLAYLSMNSETWHECVLHSSHVLGLFTFSLSQINEV